MRRSLHSLQSTELLRCISLLLALFGRSESDHGRSRGQSGPPNLAGRLPKMTQLGHEGQHFADVRSPVRSERCYTSSAEVSSVCSRPFDFGGKTDIRQRLPTNAIYEYTPHSKPKPYAVFSNSSRPISMRRISLVPAPIS
jgi:hypothetical protein